METNETNNLEIKKEWGESAGKFIDALQIENVAGNYTLASKIAGVNRSYMSQLMLKFPEFDALCRQLKADAKKFKGDIAEGELMKLVREGNVTAVIFALKKYNPDEFGDKGVDKPSDIVRHDLSDEFKAFLANGKLNNKKSQPSRG